MSSQGHNTSEVGIEPPTSRSGVIDSTTRPPCSPVYMLGTLAFSLIFHDAAQVIMLKISCHVHCKLERKLP